MIEFSRWVNCLQTCDPGLLTTYSYILACPVFAVALWVIQSNNTSVNYSSDSISPTRQWRREICLHRSPTTPAPFLTSSFAPAVVFFVPPSRTVDLPPWHSLTWLQAKRWRRILQGSEIVALTAFNDMYFCSLASDPRSTWSPEIAKKNPRFSSSQGLDIVLWMVPCSLCRCGQCYCI